MDKVNFDKEVAEYYDEVIEKGYHDNKKYLSELFKILKKNESVLELGCGTGKILLRLLERDIFVEGIDISKSMTEILKSKNKNATIHISKLIDFEPIKKYNYILSCNGPFSIKGDELESYIFDKEELVKILEKYAKMAEKGLLINIGTEKPEIKIPLDNGGIFIHKETKIEDYTIMTNFIFHKEKVVGVKTFVKKRYNIKDILKNAKIKDLGNFKLIQF